MADLIAFLNARLDEDEEKAEIIAGSVGYKSRASREVAFKRAILGEHRTAAGWSSDNWPLSLRLLVAVWSDHPDYDQEWKP